MPRAKGGGPLYTALPRLYVLPHQAAAIAAYAKRHGIKRAEAIRRLLDKALEL